MKEAAHHMAVMLVAAMGFCLLHVLFVKAKLCT